MSLSQRILAYYKKHPNNWISGGEIERLVAEKTTYKASNASRRLRELHEDDLLERDERKGTVFYKYKPQPVKVQEVQIVGGTAYVGSKTLFVWT